MEARTSLIKRKHLPPLEREQEGSPGPQSRALAEPGAGDGRGEATTLLLSMGTGQRGLGHTPRRPLCCTGLRQIWGNSCLASPVQDWGRPQKSRTLQRT